MVLSKRKKIGKKIKTKSKKSSETQKALNELSEMTDSYVARIKKKDEDIEGWWNSLSQKAQMQAFYSVMKRVHQGEFEENKSYRGILYKIFGFPLESYTLGMACGFFNLHQCIEKNSRENLKIKIKLALEVNDVSENKIDWKKIGEVLHWD